MLKDHPDINLVNEGANTLDFARSIIDQYQPRKRFDSGTWGIMGIGMGYAIGAAVTSGKQVVAIEGDSAFGFSGMELGRNDLPLRAAGLHDHLQQQRRLPRHRREPDRRQGRGADGLRQERPLRQDDRGLGGIGYNATTPDELTKALTEAIASGKPTLINAVIDEAAGTESGRLTNLNPQSGKK